VASTFLLRCPELTRFVFIGPEVQKTDITPTEYASYLKLTRREALVEGRVDRFEDTWKDGDLFFDCMEELSDGEGSQ